VGRARNVEVGPAQPAARHVGQRPRDARLELGVVVGEQHLARRILVAGWRSQDPFGTIFAAGLASMVLFQFFVNIGMSIGLLPITGIPLPFISHGGASLISLFIGLGIIQSINVRQGRSGW
jgi:hypothetical protein